MGPSFNEQFDQLGVWRKGFASQLAEFRSWLGEQELLDAAVQDHLQRLEAQLRDDKVCVAFVAEFSRGKSELINAIFFAHYGRRIMPASPGRTTMCPTELGYDPALPACMRLLPIETREQTYSLAQWRSRPSTWVQLPLDVDDPDQLAAQIAKVAETRTVTVDEARTLGFWNDALPQDNPMVDDRGLVEVPRWRHALVNMAHPLLKQGLVILDTPGLNAVGAEPELTVNQIALAHAVVFLLGADTGVTKSDLAIWREHLLPSHREGESHLVVLNKIDALWNGIDSAAQVQVQLERQRQQSAQMLNISPQRILPLSAQKGLQAKIEQRPDLLAESGLPAFEDALAQGILAHRQSILLSAVTGGVRQMQTQVRRAIQIRRRDLDEQMLELRSLRGKNATVIDSMRQRIEQEQRSFDSSSTRILALRTVHLRLMNQAFQHLGATSQRRELEQLAQALEHSGLKLGVRKVYASTFERLRELGDKVRAAAAEVQAMLGASFKDLNAEFGFSLLSPEPLQLHDFEQALGQLEQSYLQYLGFGNVLKLANPLFGERLIKALGMRLRSIFENAANDLDLWSKAATAQLDAQLKERKRSFARRIEAVDRIQHAASGLMEHIAQVESAESLLQQLDQQLHTRCEQLLHLPVLEGAACAVTPAVIPVDAAGDTEPLQQ
ncbi:dynamin family protein [Comamonas nitrativorans]|uniref:Dynamin family protein n=1 Tax=Comamonas nitrativorans TaxID=108437 RepID=A0ABV9GZ04_9BURK